MPEAMDGLPTSRPANEASPLLSQTATGRRPRGKPWESQPESGRRFTSQPDRRPTERYEPRPAPIGTSHTSRRFSLLPARRLSRGRHLLRGAPAGRLPSEREVQRRRPEQGPRPHVLRPAQPGRLRGLAAAPQGPVLTRQASGRRSGPPRGLGCGCSDNRRARTRSWRSVMEPEWRCPFAGARGQSGEDGCRSPLCGMWRLRRAHRAFLVALATGSSEREPVEHPPSGGA